MTTLSLEDRALRETCAMVDRSAAGRLELTGPDRLRFANAYLTCDVKGLAPGSGTYGFLTSSQGRILSDVVVHSGRDLRAPAPLEPVCLRRDALQRRSGGRRG